MPTKAISSASTLEAPPSRGEYTVDDALRDQQQMTPLERFSRTWSEDAPPAQAKFYRDLIPRGELGDDQQYRFDVDLDKCFGCKSCVSACHHQNGLDEEETWRSVGLLVGDGAAAASPAGENVWQHLTTACHHCLEPACLIGCPTNAYEKDPTTGIVWHLDDQCFGCQYCVMTCPYQVPQYNAEKGIVRKCDMCRDRLAADEAPACVQSCPSQAIQITRVAPSELRRSDTVAELAPATPPSALTTPSTRYRTQNRDLQGLQAADADRRHPEHAHPALVLMLVMTQWSVGILSLELLLLTSSRSSAILTLASGIFALFGLAAATLHLGRPLLAYRAVLGWRRSWLSREAIAFGVYGPLVVLLGAAHLNIIASPARSPLYVATITAAVVSGWIGVYCSAQIYQFTKRRYWQGHRSWFRFSSSAVIAAGSTAPLILPIHFDAPQLPKLLIASIVGLIVASSLKLLHEFYLCLAGDTELDRATRHLLWKPLRRLTQLRLLLATSGGLIIPAAILIAQPTPSTSFVGFLIGAMLSLAGELCERVLFFRAVAAWRMPGGIAS